jgi:branched-chain amino acid transport system permease protein
MKYRHTKKFALLGAIVLAFVASHFSYKLNSYYLQVVIFIGINVTLAVSLNLINGYAGQFSLGHAGFMAIGAYVAAYLSMEHSAGIFSLLGGTSAWSIAVVFLLVLLAGGLAAAVAGLIVGIPSLRLKGDYLAIVTLGFGEIIRVLIQNTDAVGGPRGLSGIAGYTNLFWTYSLAAITIYVVVSLIDSTYGRGFLTVRDDEIAAEAVGVNTTRYKVTAFVLGAFFAGIAGGLYAHSTTYINPSGFDFQKSIEIVIMVILGGMGSTAGRHLRGHFAHSPSRVPPLCLGLSMVARPRPPHRGQSHDHLLPPLDCANVAATTRAFRNAPTTRLGTKDRPCPART